MTGIAPSPSSSPSSSSSSSSPLDIDLILAKLHKRRTVFCSEADFQHEFARQIRINYKNAYVRCEFPVSIYDGNTNTSRDIRIDILVVLNNGNITYVCPIELKYKTRGWSVPDKGSESLGLAYNLKNHAAHPLGRFDYLADIERLEILKGMRGVISANICIQANQSIRSIPFNSYFSNINGYAITGYAIFLTNDISYVNVAKGISSNFSLENGRTLPTHPNSMSWPIGTPTRTIGSARNRSITLSGTYTLNWKTYPQNNSNVKLCNTTGRWELHDVSDACTTCTSSNTCSATLHSDCDEFVYLCTQVQ